LGPSDWLSGLAESDLNEKAAFGRPFVSDLNVFERSGTTVGAIHRGAARTRLRAGRRRLAGLRKAHLHQPPILGPQRGVQVPSAPQTAPEPGARPVSTLMPPLRSRKSGFGPAASRDFGPTAMAVGGESTSVGFPAPHPNRLVEGNFLSGDQLSSYQLGEDRMGGPSGGAE